MLLNQQEAQHLPGNSIFFVLFLFSMFIRVLLDMRTLLFINVYMFYMLNKIFFRIKKNFTLTATS